MTRKEYFEYNAVSRSLLMKLKYHPKYAKNMMEYGSNEESEALLIGDAFDTLMFDGKEMFDEKFHVLQYENPFSDGRSFMGKLMNKCIELMVADDRAVSDIAETAYDTIKTKTSVESEIIEQFNKSTAMGYLNELRVEKITLTTEQYLSIIALKEQLLNNPFVNKYFIEFPIKGQDTYEFEGRTLIYQKVILATIAGVECKAMLDIIKIDHDRKVITPIDLKSSMEKAHRFDGTILKYDYAYQGGFYTLALEQWRDNEYPGYAILPFRFIFSEKTSYFEPLIYTLNNKDINITIYGGQYNGRPVRGIIGLLEDYKWHMENNLWEYRKEVYDANGMVISDLYDYVDVWDMLKED